MVKINIPRGTKDILPAESMLWQYVEAAAQEIFELYNFKEIRTPVFESTELFTRSIGSNTDIVSKEMYTFQDRKGRSLTLRPEGTAPIIRAYLENNTNKQESVTKWWYRGPMFRYERPQAGRYRQFHQIGCEVISANVPYNDAEVISMAHHFFSQIGIKDLEVHINSVGCQVCRPVIKEKLKSFLGENLDNLCEDCQKRFKTNPLRILDCKNPQCQKYFVCLPDMSDVLCTECREHFHDVKNYLNMMRIKFKVNPRLVRGLDYYTKTVFEVVSQHLGAQNAVCGGGRYDTLVESLGGPAVPAVGFAFGMERLVMVMVNQKIEIKATKPFLFFLPFGENPKNRSTILANKLRRKGIPLEIDNSDKSIAAKMKQANKLGVEYAYIIGEDELVRKHGLLKDMASGKQTKIAFDKLLTIIEKKYQLYLKKKK